MSATSSRAKPRQAVQVHRLSGYYFLRWTSKGVWVHPDLRTAEQPLALLTGDKDKAVKIQTSVAEQRFHPIAGVELGKDGWYRLKTEAGRALTVKAHAADFAGRAVGQTIQAGDVLVQNDRDGRLFIVPGYLFEALYVITNNND